MSDTEVTVNSLSDIKRALANFSPSSKSSSRHLLMDGIDIIKARIEAHKRAEEEFEQVKEELGDFVPARMQDPSTARFWVDDIIEKRLRGKRIGTKITWDLKDGSYEWDPYSGEIKEC